MKQRHEGKGRKMTEKISGNVKNWGEKWKGGG